MSFLGVRPGMGDSDETLIAKARVHRSRRLIESQVKRLGIAEIFFQSQSWKGYKRACDSWHDAYWKWVDQATPPTLLEKLKALRQWDWSRLPVAADAPATWRVELFCQEYLQQRVLFLLHMSGPEAQDPETYSQYAENLLVAKRIGDDTFSNALAKQKKRKPTKDVGDRRLKFQLLLCWIPACLWALTTEGIGEFLQSYYPRSGNKPYDGTAISGARRALRLYRSPKPLWRGIAGNPLRLVPRR